MLSYRHGFHAGNFADCHKHASLVSVLAALAAKSRPMSLLDAFAGAGEYRLDDEFARKTGEAAGGIGRLLQATLQQPQLAAEFAAYFDALGMKPAGHENGAMHVMYPGSPRLLQRALRAGDELHLLELHSTDYPLLKRHFRADERVHVHHRDAYEGVPALLPMHHRRGLVLLDPSFERVEEYAKVASLLEKAYSLWPQGVYALWYPLLADAERSRQAKSMKDAIVRSGITRVFCHELNLYPQAHGMQGSGMLWVNLPWQQDAALARLGKALQRALEDHSGEGQSRAEWLVGE